MFSEFDHVRIKATGVTGTIVDIPEGEHPLYTIESDEKGVPGGIGRDDDWKFFDCYAEEIELVK